MNRILFLKNLLLAVYRCIGISWDKKNNCLNDGNAYFNKCTFSRLYKENFIKIMHYSITSEDVIIKKRNTKRNGESLVLNSNTFIFRLSEYIYEVIGIDIYRYHKYYLSKTDCNLSCGELIMTIVEKVITPQLFAISKTDNKENDYGYISRLCLKQLTIRCLQDMLNDNLTGFKLMHIPVMSEIELEFKDFYSDIVQADEEIREIYWENIYDIVEINKCIVNITEEVKQLLSSPLLIIKRDQMNHLIKMLQSIYKYKNGLYIGLNELNMIACYKQIVMIYKKVCINKPSISDYRYNINYNCNDNTCKDLHFILIKVIFLFERMIFEKWKIAYPNIKEIADEMDYNYIDVVELYDYETKEGYYGN